MKIINNNWTDVGYIISFSAVCGIIHWIGFVIAIFSIILSILILKNELKKEDLEEEK
ncbi:MAG: hypothetical protein ACOC56_03010 [Atribacterota bacterium]